MGFAAVRHAGSIVWKRRPIHFTFFVTRRCNARCPFCFYLSHNRGAARDERPELTLPEIERVSSSLGPLLWLAFSGGEVFLRDDLAEVAEVFYRNNRPVHILLPTNGLLPAQTRKTVESILQTCRNSTVTVKLSLDGPEPLHDELRGVRGAYGRVMESCRLLGDLLPRYPNFELGVNTVLCARNEERIGEVRGIVGRLGGVSTHTVSLIRGDVSEPSLKEVGAEGYGRVMEETEPGHCGGAGRYRFRGARLKAAQDILQRRSILKAMKNRERDAPCYAGRLNVVLTEAGDVYPCESFAYPMGNVREEDCDLMAVLRSPAAKDVRGRIRRKECWCTHECYHMTNIFFNPASYPALAGEYVKGLVQRTGGERVPDPA